MKELFVEEQTYARKKKFKILVHLKTFSVQ